MKGESEVNAWNVFRQNVLVPKDRGQRVENFVGAGFPDTNLCLNGIEAWMEIKAGKEPVRETTSFLTNNHPLNQDQKNWFLAQKRAKGLGFIYIQTDKRRIFLNGCKWADQINYMTVKELVKNSMWWAERPTEWDEWKQLRELIANHG